MKSMSPKVTVIVPVYNAEKYLTQCLDSLVNQTLGDIEIVIVNDGSTDLSYEICGQYAGADDRIVLISQDNQGLGAARKAGMKRATGEYIGFVDSDDWVDLEMFRKMYDAASGNQCDIVFCNCVKESETSKVKGGKQIRNGYYNRQQIVEEILPRTLAGLNAKGNTHVIRWSNCLRIFRRELLEKNNIYHDPRFRRCQDLQLTLEATLWANGYYYLGDEYLYHNRETAGSLSRGYTKNMWYYLRMLIERLYEDVAAFEEYGLGKQMDLCAFFFVVSCCKNEAKEASDVTETQHLENIKAICEDVIVEKCLCSLPLDKLSKINRAYWQALKDKDAQEVVKVNRKADKLNRQEALLSTLLKNPLIRAIYLFFKSK